MKNYQHIIWDWNGTLLDDGWLFVDIMNTILKKRNMKPISLEKYKKIFCFPVKEYYKKLGFDFNQTSFEEHGIEFIEEYKKRMYEAKLYPQVYKILNKLNQKGINNSILSAQNQTFLNILLKFYKIYDQFEHTIGLDNHYANSKIENGINLISLLNIDPKSILMIGDTSHDYDVAKILKIDCCLISHGHYSKERLINTGTRVLKNLEEIACFLKLTI